jgi:hypothetical protein
MSETFFLYFFGLIFAFVLGICAIWWIGMANATKKYLEESKKLRAVMNLARQTVGDLSENPKGFMGDVLGGMGVDGIIDALGIPSIFKPVAKGFIDNLTKNPEQLQGLLDKFGIKVSPQNHDKDESKYL